MKIRLIGFVIALFFIQGVSAQDLASNAETKNTKSAVFKWNNQSHDFGKIKKGIPVTHEFSFTNSGDTPLIITSVKGSCGCTVTDYTKASIAPGKKGFVKATYNAAKLGAFNKTVSVTANTEAGQVILKIKGEVVE